MRTLHIAWIAALAMLASLAQPGAGQTQTQRNRSGGASLGVRFFDITAEQAKAFQLRTVAGVIVLDFMAGSAARNDGIKVGDLLVAIDDDIIQRNLPALMARRRPGDVVKVSVLRDGKPFRLKVTLGSEGGAEPPPTPTPGLYRDPQGRFSVQVPTGWEARSERDAARIGHGNAYALIVVVSGGGRRPPLILERIRQFGRQWNFQENSAAGETLAGRPAIAGVHTGYDEAGLGTMMLKTVSVAVGEDAYLLLMVSPAREFEQNKPALDQIDRSFSIPGSPEPPSGTKPPDRGSASRGLPAGFKAAGAASGPRQALYRTFTSGGSALQEFRGMFAYVAPYFDQKPKLLGAWTDGAGTQVEGIFSASFAGANVLGIMVLALARGSGYGTVLFDRREEFQESLPALSKRVATAVLGGFEPGTRGQEPVKLTRTTFPDGSGTIGLPPGWRIVNSYQGTIDLVGPGGATAAFGGALLISLPGTPFPASIVAPYHDLAATLGVIDNYASGGAIASGRRTIHILDQAAVPFPNGPGAYFHYEAETDGVRTQALSLVGMWPLDQSRWMAYNSFVSCRSDRFASDLPGMLEMWRSWSVSEKVRREKMDAALRSMREIGDIIQGVHDRRERAMDNSALGWSEVMRGVNTIEDTVTGRSEQVDITRSEDVLRLLNRSGERYRAVPLNELER